MKRDTSGKSRSKSTIPKDHRFAHSKNLGLGSEMWGANYERSSTANRQGGKSTRTKARSASLARAGTGLIVAGRFIPILGYAWAYDDLMKGSKDSEIAKTTSRQYDRNVELIGSSADIAMDVAFKPSGVAQTIAHVALWSVLS